MGSAWDPVGIPEGSDAFLWDPGFWGPMFYGGSSERTVALYNINEERRYEHGAFWGGPSGGYACTSARNDWAHGLRAEGAGSRILRKRSFRMGSRILPQRCFRMLTDATPTADVTESN